jgi:hypothetical protein
VAVVSEAHAETTAVVCGCGQIGKAFGLDAGRTLVELLAPNAARFVQIMRRAKQHAEHAPLRPTIEFHNLTS